MKTIFISNEEARYVELQLMALDFARQGETESLAAMLRAGLPVNLADAKGQSLLMLASYHGHFDTAQLLLATERMWIAATIADRRPLGGVAFKGYENIAVLLLKHGADINADNGAGMTPIMYASLFGRAKAVELLRAHGASLETTQSFGDFGWPADSHHPTMATLFSTS